MDTGKKIALCRKDAGMSQEALAAEMGISRQAVSRWETGEALPDTSKIIQLAQLFNVSCDYLLLDEVENTSADVKNDLAKEKNHIKKKQEIFRIISGIILVLLGIWFISLPFRTMYGTIWAFILGMLILIAGAYLLFIEYKREN